MDAHVLPTDWRAFFDSHAPHYDQNPFTKDTLAEVDFLLTLFPIPVGAKILDVGCGTGRHSIELARRGYEVTGLDLSEGMLEVARAKASEAGVEVRWICADATAFKLDQVFDAAICLCEGGFGLLGSEDDPWAHDSSILARISEHLKPGAGFLLTALNGYSALRRMKDEHVANGAFNPATMVAHYEDEWELPEGNRIVQIRERLFIAPEVVRMLQEAGFRVDAVYGGTAGNWGRRPLMLDEVEAMYVCRKI